MKRKFSEDMAVDLAVYILLGLVGIVTLYPFYYTIVCSFNDGLDLMKGGVYLWPRKFTLGNYKLFLEDGDWRHAFLVSLARTLVGTAMRVGFTSMFSYALSRNNLMFKKGYRFLVVFTMYFSGGLIPFYVLLRNLGLLNSFWVYVIPGMVDAFFVMTGINFFAAIPESMIEAAKIDGAREIKVLTRVVLPVSKPFLATLALFSAVGQWNSWLDSAYYVRDAKLHTLAYKMMTVINQNIATANTEAAGQLSQANTQTSFTVQATAMAVSMLPIMCVYPFLQKYFVQGMMIGAVKE
ncbi:MAG: carbohydrate ABC transporter permease [Lachnospiraceae bacterium]|jgi:putative aldouronate transport system permease protein|nr:carbohydrate ABC transporter permease [Lachnospiraceae bacterium]MDE6976015.1 carbohydrate ABC transporter permease [Lachnospiraceae bacterium]